LKALYLLLVLFIGLALNARDGRDRWIYIAFLAATVVAIIHYRHPNLSFSHWRL